MFNFIGERKKELKLPSLQEEYNIINLSGKALCIEGHKGLLMLGQEKIMVKLNGKILVVYGANLKIKEMTKQTLNIIGEIEKTEVV